MTRLKRQLKFANVIALVALFVSLGGGVYAASKINGKQIKKSSIAGSKLKADTVTGSQVNESTLGTVPSARSADSARTADSATTAVSAQTADNAQTLAGSGPGSFVSSGDLRRMNLDVTAVATTPDVTRTLLALGPLQLIGVCDPGNFPGDVGRFSLQATSSAPGARYDVNYTLDTTAATGGGPLNATPVNVVSPATNSGSQRYVGNFVYNDATTTITAPYVLALEKTPGETKCFFTGTAARATG